ncbi:MAG: glycosyltransferase, partial [bacterium]|nr:glycosyltransferase [bacterium]
MADPFKKRVVFVGGETAGPLMPLLAIAENWKHTNAGMVSIFVDVKKSVAAHVVPKEGFVFKPIIADKLRRYVAARNILSPLFIFVGFIQALFLLAKLRPVLVMGAGGYVQFPVVLAAWLLRIPSVVHQQDVHVTLSNKLCAPFATKITTTFEKSVKDFSQGLGFGNDFSKLQKVVWVGNPARGHIASSDKTEAQSFFKLDPAWPTLLVLGGGSGAAGLNEVIVQNLNALTSVVQIIHSTGQGKEIPVKHPRYHQYSFIDRMDLAYAAADIVMARGGIGTITELSQLKKLAIIVPMPDSHQEANAELLFTHKAAIILDEREIQSELLTKVIRKLLFDSELQKHMQANIRKVIPADA